MFIHIGTEQTDTLAHIPKTLLFPIPGLPKGYVLLGFDKKRALPEAD